MRRWRVGEIWVASPSVARGYWRARAVVRETFARRLADGDGPFLRTGDLGVLRDGELFVTGRLKDVLIVRGFKHYPQDLELTAERQHAAIRSGCAAAFALDEAGRDEVAIAIEVDPRALSGDRDERVEQLHDIVAAVRRAVTEEHGIMLGGRLAAVDRDDPKDVERQVASSRLSSGFHRANAGRDDALDASS